MPITDLLLNIIILLLSYQKKKNKSFLQKLKQNSGNFFFSGIFIKMVKTWHQRFIYNNLVHRKKRENVKFVYHCPTLLKSYFSFVRTLKVVESVLSEYVHFIGISVFKGNFVYNLEQ